MAPALSMMTKLGSLALEREYLLSFSGDLLSAGGTTIVGALTLHASLYLCLRGGQGPPGGRPLIPLSSPRRDYRWGASSSRLMAAHAHCGATNVPNRASEGLRHAGSRGPGLRFAAKRASVAVGRVCASRCAALRARARRCSCLQRAPLKRHADPAHAAGSADQPPQRSRPPMSGPAGHIRIVRKPEERRWRSAHGQRAARRHGTFLVGASGSDLLGPFVVASAPASVCF